MFLIARCSPGPNLSGFDSRILPRNRAHRFPAPNAPVAIVVNDGGLGKGAVFADGLVLRERLQQDHIVALMNLGEGDEVIRYNVVIGYANQPLPKDSWISEHMIRMPAPPELDSLPIATRISPDMPALEGYTFEGYRNRGGSVGSRNILVITTTVQCVADVVAHAITRIKTEMLPRFPKVNDIVGLATLWVRDRSTPQTL